MICKNCIHSEVCKHKTEAVYECEHFNDTHIPKKTLWGATSNASWRSCPVCHSRQNKTYKYCSQCGQALDWGDTE